MIAKRKMTPLLLKDNTTSIYFNFEDKEIYETKFEGALTRGFSGNQKTNTFFLSLIIIYVVAPISIFLLNQFVFQNKLVSIVFSFVIGLAIGYFLVKSVLSEIIERKLMVFSSLEIKRISRKAIRNGRILNITMVCFILFSLIGLFVSLNLSKQGFSKFLFYNGLSGFVIMGIKASSHPKAMIKAGKILKKQLKEGKLDD